MNDFMRAKPLKYYVVFCPDPTFGFEPMAFTTKKKAWLFINNGLHGELTLFIHEVKVW